MKKIIVSLAIASLFAPLAFAEQVRISVSDLIVESNNKSYEFLGKGMSRLIISELRKSGQIKLIERENLNKVLEEQAFSLSDLADQDKQLKIGMLLAAQYIVVGEIIDMADVLLFSLRMINVETGEIVWFDEIKDKLATYDYISSYLAKSMLDSMKIRAEQSTLAKIEKKEEKKTEAIVKLSDGIDAYDKKDEVTAKKELEAAQALDPENEVAREFLFKIAAVSPKFRVETELFSPAYNPASLGFIDKDMVFFWGSNLINPPWVTLRADIPEDQASGDYWASNFGDSQKIGYMLPLWKNAGMAAEFVRGGYRWLAAPRNESITFTFDSTTYSEIKYSFSNIGGSLSLGMQLLENFSVGGSCMLWETSKGPGTSVIVDPGVYWAAGGGVMLKTLQDRLTIDSSVMYSSQSMYYADIDALEILRGSMPLLAEGSVTYVVIDRLLFAGLKGIGNIYLDERGGFALRLIPIVEYQPFDFLYVRGGYEFSLLDQAGTSTMGHGFLAGVTVKLWAFELNANLTYSVMPARLLPGHTVENFTLLFGGSYSPLFVGN